MSWYVYMIRCEDDSLYTGSTDNVKRRFKAHKDGRGAKYTRSHKPVEVVYTEETADKSAALKREYEIKKMKRKEKLKLAKIKSLK